MQKKFILTAFVCLTFFMTGNAQTWSIHLNGNETYPIGNELLGQYPFLWYSTADDRGILFGGFGAGVSRISDWKENVKLKYQANFQRSRFYDEPSVFTDVNGQPLGAIIGINTNWNFSLLAIPQLLVLPKKNLYLGLGLGARAVLFSRTDYGKAVVHGNEVDLKLKNKSLAPAVLILPFELAWHGNRFSVTTRAELSLTKTSRLSSKNDRSLIVFGEIGYKF